MCEREGACMCVLDLKCINFKFGFVKLYVMYVTFAGMFVYLCKILLALVQCWFM